MKKALLMISVVVLGLASCQNESTQTISKKTDQAPEPEISVARGEYLVNAMGCDDCHSPKRMGAHGPEIIAELRFSGYPSGRPLQPIDKENLSKGWALFNGDLTSAVGPWGQSFAANITSDPTGIGNWDVSNFMTALRKGKYKGLESGRNLLPPMPWTAHAKLTDEDIISIFSFLKTTKPVKNVVPAPIAPGDLK